MTTPGPVAMPVVLDINVMVQAVAGGNTPYRSWPSPPHASGNPAADCLGVLNDAAEVALYVSPHIVSETERVLRDVLGWAPGQAAAYTPILIDIAESSGGGLIDPPMNVLDCGDWEDNFILDLVVDVGAPILVSSDGDLLGMSPWRAVAIITPGQFIERVVQLRTRTHRASKGL